jgi:hypothetical protein
MKYSYAAEINSGAIICTPGFIMIGFAIQKLMRANGIHRQLGDDICLL